MATHLETHLLKSVQFSKFLKLFVLGECKIRAEIVLTSLFRSSFKGLSAFIFDIFADGS